MQLFLRRLLAVAVPSTVDVDGRQIATAAHEVRVINVLHEPEPTLAFFLKACEDVYRNSSLVRYGNQSS